MFLKIVEPESTTIYQIDTSEFYYGHAAITSLEQLDEVGGPTQIDSYRRHGNPLTDDHADRIGWAKFFCDGDWICVVMATGVLQVYLESDLGETIERIV